MDQRRLKLAMKLGDTYRVRDVAPRQFQQLAKALDLDASRTIDRASELADLVREKVVVVADREKHAGLTHPIVDRMVTQLRAHAARCAKVLALAR